MYSRTGRAGPARRGRRIQINRFFSDFSSYRLSGIYLVGPQFCRGGTCSRLHLCWWISARSVCPYGARTCAVLYCIIHTKHAEHSPNEFRSGKRTLSRNLSRLCRVYTFVTSLAHQTITFYANESSHGSPLRRGEESQLSNIW